ncbi:MacS family sensor histidine kinase [Streptomyces sp. MAR4 CNX-425]|uniref:MacS family sensor histidine kinase n=1 Tax=Streptomyces sp. MAR4 CNX-425 TaxID=3406343 RepID=UPI003B5060D4
MAGQSKRRMSVEQPLWQALTYFRVLTLAYAVAQFVPRHGDVARPALGWAYFAVLALWTAFTFRRVASAERCTYRFLAADIGLTLTGILLTIPVETPERIDDGASTLPSIWAAGSVLGFAIKGGWRWGAASSAAVGLSNIVQRGEVVQDNFHNIVLLMVASTAIGYIVEVARTSERALARALQIEAATRERERLARDIHDSVLQVLALVQRRGAAIGGEAKELGRLAGEQEAALRALVTGATLPAQRTAPPPERSAVPGGGAGARAGAADGGPGEEDATTSLRLLLLAMGGPSVSVAEPGSPVSLRTDAAQELAAAVGAALDNVRAHVGPEAQAWVLLEEEPDGTVVVTVRDDGPGIPRGRLAAAEAEGRLGVAQSIRGRLRDLGGTAEWVSTPGQGTEVELRLPAPHG